jgi:hypothetical protein
LKGNSHSHQIEPSKLWSVEHDVNHYTMTFSGQNPFFVQVIGSFSSILRTQLLHTYTHNSFWSVISFTAGNGKNVQCHLYFLYMLPVTKKLLCKCRLLFSDYRHHTIRFSYVLCASKS